MAFVEPVTLEARGVRLVPLALEHEAGLKAAAADGELWKLRITSVPEPHETRGYIETALATANRFAFAVTDAASRPASSEVTLWAVDYGVLSLTGYHAPDVLGSVYQHKSLQVMNEDSRQRIVLSRGRRGKRESKQRRQEHRGSSAGPARGHGILSR